MRDAQTLTVPDWVRVVVCLAGSASIPALILFSAFGGRWGSDVSVAVGAFAICTARLAFGTRNEKVEKIQNEQGQT